MAELVEQWRRLYGGPMRSYRRCELAEVISLLQRYAPQAVEEAEIAEQLVADGIEVRVALRFLWREGILHCAAPGLWALVEPIEPHAQSGIREALPDGRRKGGEGAA